MNQLNAIPQILEEARRLAATGEDAAARAAFVSILRIDPTHLRALTELGTMAFESGFRSAARTAFEQAALHHPANASVRVNLGHLLLQEGELERARSHLEDALAIDPELISAHQGLAQVFAEIGHEKRAALHRQIGFEGHAIARRRYRGTGHGRRVLLLATTGSGNIPLDHILDARVFAVTVIYPEFVRDDLVLPEHDVVLNTIGDADICDFALECAQAILARTDAPAINNPAAVRRTGRVDVSRRLEAIAGIRAPKINRTTRAALAVASDLTFPRLLRSPGFHTGRHFHLVKQTKDLADVLAKLPGEDVLDIEYLDAYGTDGQSRKYRVMMIDGALYPLHLAISNNWKVHYFTADMIAHAAHRAEEELFLTNMEETLGPRAMSALHEIARCLALDYAGVDFAIDPNGALLLFEANATMVILPPGPEPIWDYRRAPIKRALDAVQQMLRDAPK